MNVRRGRVLVSLGLFAALMAIGVSAKARMAEPTIVQGRTIVIDAGHGGFDPGALGQRGTIESTINLAIAQKLRAELIGRGYCIIMTREDEQALGKTKQADMQARQEIIANSGADYVVSIHLNANRDTSCYGPVVLHHPDSEVGGALARALQQTLNETLEIIRPRTVQTGQFFILKSGPMPSVIVECGFITHLGDEALLSTDEYQTRVAAAIAQGLDEFITAHIDAINAQMYAPGGGE